MKETNDTHYKRALGYFRNVLIPVLCYSTIAGIVVGTIVGLYTKLASLLTHWSHELYVLVHNNPVYTPVVLLVAAAIGLLIALLLKFTPECKGSGVPRTEGVLRGLLTFRWLRVFLTTIGASLLTYFSGASLGSEGPSIQIGATSAQGCSEVLRCRMAWSKYVMSAGAGTGLAVAFNAPLTGIIFVIEEVHKRVTPMILLTAACCVTVGTLTSNAISLLWGGTGYLFDFGAFPDQFQLQNIWMLLILGVVIGLASVLFNWLIFNSQKIINKHFKLPQWAKLVITLVICAGVGVGIPATVGGGHDLIMEVGNMAFLWWMLLVLLFVKLFLIVLSFNSGATGGLFIPMLSLGALIGGLLGNAFIAAGLDEVYFKLIVVISMSAFFGASVRTPITATVLVMEVTGHFHSFLFTAIVIFIAYFVAELFRVEPLYDGLLEGNLKDAYKDKIFETVEIDVAVTEGSFADHKQIRDLLWPPECHVKGITRDEENIIPTSTTIMHAHDILHITVDTYDIPETETYIRKLVNE